MTTLPCDCSFTSWNPCSCSNYPVTTGGGGGSQEVFGGNGSPTMVPTVSFAFYIQQDSTPAGQIWEWFGGGWHLLMTGGGGGGTQEVFTGTGSPTGITPTGVAAIYIQQDSIPPGIIWQFYNGSWH